MTRIAGKFIIATIDFAWLFLDWLIDVFAEFASEA